MRTRRRGKATRLDTRVDFTPMVDMMMLLLTFFMFCTTLIKPQIMDLAMPTADDPNPGGNVPDSKAITFILADSETLYYYEGIPDYEDYTSLKKIKYGQLRDVLVHKNKEIVKDVNELTKKLNAKQMSEADYKLAVAEAKKSKAGAVAVIKPMEASIYQNLVNVLDEMAICSVGRYAVVDMTDGDDFLVKNYETKGLYAQEGGVNH